MECEFEEAGVVQARTATLVEVMPRVYDVETSEGHTYRWFTDPTGSYAGLLHGDALQMVLLEHGATSRGAPFADADVHGASFTGEAVLVNADGSLAAAVPCGVSVNAGDGGFSGYVATTTFVPPPSPPYEPHLTPDAGIYTGWIVDSTGASGYLGFYLSPNRRFAFGVATNDQDDPRPCCDDRVYFLLTRK